MSSRAYSKQETIDNVLCAINECDRFYRRNEGQFIAFCIFSEFDGGTLGIPYFELNAIGKNGTEEDLGDGELHSLILRTDKELKGMLEKGHISPITNDFIKTIKSLMKRFDQGEIETRKDLILEILKVVDSGIEETKFELKSSPHPEDMQFHIEEGENYYVEGIEIAGNLAKRYEELY